MQTDWSALFTHSTKCVLKGAFTYTLGLFADDPPDRRRRAGGARPRPRRLSAPGSAADRYGFTGGARHHGPDHRRKSGHSRAERHQHLGDGRWAASRSARPSPLTPRPATPAGITPSFRAAAADMLLRNGELTSAATTSKAPRTVLGTRDDGSCVILVCDGRQSGLADGISLRDAALQLQAQGCTNVVNLDAAARPSSPRASMATRQFPSSHPPRMAVRAAAPISLSLSMAETRACPLRPSAVYPQNEVVMAGAQVELSSKSLTPTTSPRQRTLKALPSPQAAGTVDGIYLYRSDEGGTVTVGRSFRHHGFAGRCVHRL